jgi:hypothetical protein
MENPTSSVISGPVQPSQSLESAELMDIVQQDTETSGRLSNSKDKGHNQVGSIATGQHSLNSLSDINTSAVKNGGAPSRQWLNQHVTPTLVEAMRWLAAEK